MAVKWYASGNYFSPEPFRISGPAGPQPEIFSVQSLPNLVDQLPGTFVEIENIELEEIWFNSWRWGFKFKNGLQSDFDSVYLLKKFKLLNDHPHINRVEIHSDSWDGQEHCLCGLKFFNKKEECILQVGDFKKTPKSIILNEHEKIIGVFSYKHP
jgi:hypothetical protein